MDDNEVLDAIERLSSDAAIYRSLAGTPAMQTTSPNDVRALTIAAYRAGWQSALLALTMELWEHES
jgi:hypothetical protein